VEYQMAHQKDQSQFCGDLKTLEYPDDTQIEFTAENIQTI